MKNKSFILMAIMATIILVSCEKEEVLFDTNTNSSSTFSKESPTPPSSFNRNYFDNDADPGVEGQDYGCELVQGDCMNDILLWDTEWWERIGGILLGIEQGQGDVIETFKNNRALLSSVFPENLIDDTINGTLTLSVRGKLAKESTAYFLFKNLDGELVTAIPVK